VRAWLCATAAEHHRVGVGPRRQLPAPTQHAAAASAAAAAAATRMKAVVMGRHCAPSPARRCPVVAYHHGLQRHGKLIEICVGCALCVPSTEAAMADEEEQLRESLKNHPHLTLEELREFKELFNLVRRGARPPLRPALPALLTLARCALLPSSPPPACGARRAATPRLRDVCAMHVLSEPSGVLRRRARLRPPCRLSVSCAHPRRPRTMHRAGG